MMRIKFHTLVLGSTLVGFALVSVVVFAARNWNGAPSEVGTIASSAPEKSVGTEMAPAAATDTTKAAPAAASVPRDWGFSLALPEGWTTTAQTDSARGSDGVRRDGWIMSGVPTDAFGADLNVSTIVVTDVSKNGRPFTEVANPYLWTDADVEKIVAFMRSEAADLFPDFSAADVLIDSSTDEIGRSVAIRATQQCLKPCYVEGGAATTVRYLIDAPEVVYVLDVTVGTSENTASILNAADAVVRTFTLN